MAAIQQIQAAFPLSPTQSYPLATQPSDPNFNLFDEAGLVNASWSTGTCAITTIKTEPSNPLRKRIVYGWSLTYQGYFKSNPLLLGGNPHVYGRPGKFFAGLIQGAVNVPFTQQPLGSFPPSNPSLIAQVWDGATDPIFPSDAAYGHIPPPIFAFNYQLPQPLEMTSSSELSFGLWLTPSLMAAAEIIIADVIYSVQYESLPPQRR